MLINSGKDKLMILDFRLYIDKIDLTVTQPCQHELHTVSTTTLPKQRCSQPYTAYEPLIRSCHFCKQQSWYMPLLISMLNRCQHWESWLCNICCWAGSWITCTVYTRSGYKSKLWLKLWFLITSEWERVCGIFSKQISNFKSWLLLLAGALCLVYVVLYVWGYK